MKLFISLGLFLTLWCRLSKAQTIDITEFALTMWDLDYNKADSNLYTLDPQEQKIDDKDHEDPSPRRLFKYFDESAIYSPFGTYDTFLPLCDNYERVAGTNEVYTLKEENEISAYLDDIRNTPLIIEAANQFQKDGHVVDLDDFLRQLRTAFFDLHGHEEHEDPHSIHEAPVNDSCGFELIFCGEIEDPYGPNSGVHGLYNWITFYEQEKPGNDYLNYFGYFDSIPVDGSRQLMEVQFSWMGYIVDSSPMFVGVSTEFELAMYMACFFKGEECIFTINGVTVEVHVHHAHDFESHISEAYMHHI